MAYYRRNFRNYSKPTPRNIELKFTGTCICCGAVLKAGAVATYYPVGTIAGVTEGKVAHIGALDGTSKACFNHLKVSAVDHNVNDYAGDGLDSRYEDDCARACGL